MTSSPSEPLPLGQIMAATKAWVDRLGRQWVAGQVIEIKRRPNSKWQFLTLRDRLADVSASLMLTSEVLAQAGPLTDGMSVVAHIKPQVNPRGGLNFSCSDLRPVGEGRLLAQLEQRKQLLRAEGLFESTRKNPLPRLPRAIGLVTGAGSAAERDVVDNVRRRWPAARLVVRHALVQGPDACEQVARAVTELDRDHDVEVVVIARGGGSLEDLLPFSDELLVRTVFAARTPVVSAIGHETDTPLLDLVADVRASTPTDAARRVVPDMAEELTTILEARNRVRQALVRFLDQEQRHLEDLRRRPCLVDPLYGFDRHHGQVNDLAERLERAIDTRLREERTGVGHALERVRAMSPRNTLQRGYAILADEQGAGVTSVGDVEIGEHLQVYLADGQLEVGVREVHGSTAGPRAEQENGDE